jgi:hypothetical protein
VLHRGRGVPVLGRVAVRTRGHRGFLGTSAEEGGAARR